MDADSLVEARSPDELVNALATQGGHETSGPTPVTVGGFPARRFEVTFPDDYDLAACDDRALRLWPGAEADVSSGQPANVGQRFLIYVVDVDGDAVVMVAASRSDASPSDITEMEAALASIQFTGSDAP